MNLLINDSSKIFTIQKEFNTAFPYLKFEFFSQPYLKDGEPAKKIRKSANQTFAECRSLHKQGKIYITELTTVVDLENSFCEIYGLEVQVFRKSGRAWLETSLTNNWTLKEQNKQGEDLSQGT